MHAFAQEVSAAMGPDFKLTIDWFALVGVKAQAFIVGHFIKEKCGQHFADDFGEVNIGGKANIVWGLKRS